MSKADISPTPIRSRRAVLAGIASAAALPAAAVIPATALPTAGLPATPAADPIYAMIDVHRKAHAAHMASIKLQERFERRYGGGHGSWISEKPCCDEDDIFMALVAAPATTVQGLSAKLAYFDELSGEFETEWMVSQRAEAAVLIQSFTASLKNIGVLS